MNPSQEPGPQRYEQAPHYEQAPNYEQGQSYEQGQPYYPYGEPVDAMGWVPTRPKRRPLRRTVLVAVSITAAMAVAGAPLGLLWSWLAPTIPVINAGQNGIVVNDPSPEEYIAADAWFTLIGFTFGLLAAVLIWLVLRRDRGPGLLLGVALGGLASTLVMWQAGRLVGLAAWNDWQDSSSAGQAYDRPPDLHAHGALLVAAFAAVIVTTLLAGWSNDPDLELPGAKPGYGHDLPGGPGSGGHSAGGPGSGGFGADGFSSDGFSSGSPAGPDPTAAPAPPAPWPADPPRG
ncbi:hypothetical protein ACQP2Y_10310 [Actinoplanes sp. CA-051413]|uniref:hypothetical protein n=1 Tax=Actinoplanes sp. CA-051413 TaxID=3239899 RepID=UPI003D95ED48